MERKKFRDRISDLIEGGAIDFALVYLGSVSAWLTTGPLAFLVNPILRRVWGISGDKLVRFGLRRSFWVYDKAVGAYRFKKGMKAYEDGDLEEFIDIASDA
jgi:hypothetical protein